MTGRSDDAREASGTLVWAVVDAKGWVARVWFNADDAAVDVQHMDVNGAGTPPFQVVPLVAASALASARAAGAAEAFERAAKRVSAHLDCEEAGGRCARGILDVLEQDAAAPVRP